MDDLHRTEGARAFNRGIERDRCPHTPGSEAFKGWMAGWNHQKAEFAKRMEYEQMVMKLSKAG
ncbi:hypothetical protein [Mangrovicella endophytica]|uniref:hypothetical protein n=1 Tax=Mangrovicella endophytica TaxID=2066697 RepID=UPI000C9E0DBE|nr:hypothetical protein [Mangrovicella endophytica]